MGQFHIPSYVPAGAQQLLRDMVQVNPRKRLSVSVTFIANVDRMCCACDDVYHCLPFSLSLSQLDQVIKHPWFRG